MKKLLAIILTVVMAASLCTVSFAAADVTAGEGNIYKSFGFGESDTPSWSWFMSAAAPGTDQGSEIKYEAESAENSNGVVKVLAKGGNWSSGEGLKAHNFNFSINGNGYYTFTGPYALSFDVKVNSITSGYSDYDALSSAPGVVFPYFQIGGGSSNYPATNKKPHTAGVYRNSDGTLKISAIHNAPATVVEYDTMDVEFGKWYTLKTYFDPAAKTSVSYAINKETGERKLITVDTGFDIAGSDKIGAFSLVAYGEAEYMLDNLCYYSSHEGKNASVAVSGFTKDSGLSATAIVTDNTKTAKLFVDGTEVASFNKGDVYKYNIKVPASDIAFDGLRKREIKLVCYDEAGNVADEAIANAAHNGTYKNKIASSWTGANEYNIFASNTEANITNSNNLSKFNQMTSVEYKVKFPAGVTQFLHYELTYKQDFSASEWLSQIFINEGKLTFGSQEAYKPDTWYSVKTIYDFPNGKVDTYVGEEGGEQHHVQVATAKRELYGTQWDWGLARVILKYKVSEGVTDKAQYKHVYFNRYEPVELISISSYVASDDSSVVCTDNKVPKDAKSFTIGTGAFGNISESNTKLYNGESVVEGTAISFDADEKILTVTPPAGTKLDDKYKVIIGEDATVNGAATGFKTTIDVERTDEFAFTSALSVSKVADGKYKAEIPYHNRENKVNKVLFVIATYNGNRLTKIVFRTTEVENDGANTLKTEISGVESGEKVTAMIWDDITRISPIADAVSVTAE